MIDTQETVWYHPTIRRPDAGIGFAPCREIPHKRMNMRFSLLLYVLYRLLKRAMKKNEAYHNYVGNIHNVRIMIKTADGKRGRVFIFDRGSISSRGGARHPYDTAIVWKDAKTGFRVMASQSDEAQFEAAAEGAMKLDGMPFFAKWFNEGVKMVM
jgi:hypothetical protein